jgi:Ca-activated chloride channel family protein
VTFASPQVLWLLLVFPPALVFLFWWSCRKRQALMAQFIQARLLPGLLSGVSPFRQKIRFGCLAGAVVCLILALARPQWGFSWEEVKQRGLDIVVAVDTSKSMLAQDIAPNRLARAKLAALELMSQAKSDRLGLVAFAGDAFLQCPLTIDDTAFSQSVGALDVNTIPQGGTALAAAIETAMTAFKEGDNHKVLVLMTDGEDHDSGALEAAQKAARAGLQIFTIGIGTAGGELLRVQDANGGGDYIRDDQGNVVKSHLNETLLQQIAGATEKGFYLPLRGARTIDTLFEKGLAPLPKSESNQTRVKRPLERFQWPLGLAMALLVTEMLFPERKRELKSAAPPSTPERGNSSRSSASSQRSADLRSAVAQTSSLQGARQAQAPGELRRQADQRSALQQTGGLRYEEFAFLLLLAWPCVTSASPASALREYKAGQYDQALKDYQQLLQGKGDDPRLHFNTGAAAYRNQQFDEAAKQFNEALASPDLSLQARAYYNRGNSLYWLGEQNPDPAKKTENWEKSLTDFESSAKLNPQDVDAKFNHEFVKRRLEELKQQQQQQQKNQQNKSDQQKKQDQQDQQQQQQNQQKDQSKQDQSQQQQQAGQKQPDQKQDASQQKPSDQKQEDQKQQQAAQSQGQKDQQQQQQQAQQAGQKGDKSDEKTGEEAAAYAAGQMTPEQAKQLLDAQKGDEQMLQLKPEGKPMDRNKPLRDW